VRGLGQEQVETMMPWLLSTLQSEASPVERSGAALGLAEVVAVLGADYLSALIPSIAMGCSAPSPVVREGNITLLVHLPVTCRRAFEPHLKRTLPCILQGLADESEGVRDTAMAAGMKFVELCASALAAARRALGRTRCRHTRVPSSERACCCASRGG